MNARIQCLEGIDSKMNYPSYETRHQSQACIEKYIFYLKFSRSGNNLPTILPTIFRRTTLCTPHSKYQIDQFDEACNYTLRQHLDQNI